MRSHIASCSRGARWSPAVSRARPSDWLLAMAGSHRAGWSLAGWLAPAIALVGAALILPPTALAQRTASPAGRPRMVLLDAMLRAEDERGHGGAGVTPLLDGVASADSGLRRIAVRGLGRLERPDLIDHIAPLLTDSAESVRAEAANALAQSVSATPPPGDSQRIAGVRAAVDSVFALLIAPIRRERSPLVMGVLARSIGRLPYTMPAQARDAEEAIASIVGRASASSQPPASGRAPAPVLRGAAHGLYALARARRTLGALTSPSIAVLRTAAVYGRDSAANAEPTVEAAAAIRRLAWLALTAAGHRDELLVRGAARDPDPQVRRLAVLYLPNVSDVFLQREVLRTAREDSSFLVRVEWVRLYRELFATQDCGPLAQATTDPNAHVRLVAIDALGGRCVPPGPAVERLRAVANAPPGVGVAAGAASWHERAHALVALARVDSAGARPVIAREARAEEWHRRLYAARAAAAAHDAPVLTALAQDTVANVREAALDGLSTVVGHAADGIYVAALGSRDAQVVLAAARALRGAPSRTALVTSLTAALDRLTAARRETSRDPRMELLARISELGDSSLAPRLVPYLRDFDPAVGARAMHLLSAWTHQNVVSVVPAPSSPVPLGALTTGGAVRLRLTIQTVAGAGTVMLRLDPENAPATVARIVALARAGYYNGLTWHRVVPDFVIQGGSPGANEYIGAGPFLRDELGLASHRRGTVGISTRGRDTGDAQLFVNLVDNYRLDHDYTVVGAVESGMDVIDAVLEGNAISRVEVLAGSPR
jgi:cyclophilin family peptidyl-prolyl cis-trans isomerase/HEAT repeat protein